MYRFSAIRPAGIAIAASLALFACSEAAEPPAQLESEAIECTHNQDLECAEDRWQAYVAQRPNDGNAIANLGIVQDQRDENEQAIVQFKKAIALGEGTYDLFYYYADSLDKTGKTDEAIDWYYKSLAVVPTLVDVRSNLAKLLMQKHHYYEALVLLASFDDHLVAIGQQPYFAAQRISIETAMQQASPGASAEKTEIRLPRTDSSYHAPITLGTSQVTSFVVDTGAAVTTVSEKFLKDSKAPYEVVLPSTQFVMADGRHVDARLINIDSMKLGDFELKNVAVAVCGSCELLLGQATLAHFDIASSKVQGVEFMTLKPRKL